MADSRKHLLIVGAGPAGLAAAHRALERSGRRYRVSVIHMGHHLGGKAASYKDGLGRQVDHGWHMLLGFYTRMKRLIAAADVKFEDAFSSMQGLMHCYESTDDRLHTLGSKGGDLRVAMRYVGYDGMPRADWVNFGRFMALAFSIARNEKNLLQYDDLCFDAWAREHGLRPHLTRVPLFRVIREGYFNFPEQMSAYHALLTMRAMSASSDAEIFVCKGPMSDLLWKPLAERIRALGGEITPYSMVEGWEYQGRHVRKVRVARPDPNGHNYGMTAWEPDEIAAEPGSERSIDDADVIVSTIPAAVFMRTNKADTALWQSPYFARLRHLRSVSTVAMRCISKQKIPPIVGPIFGIRAPLGNAFRMTPHLPAFAGIPGDVIDFVGQEPGFETWSDDDIRDLALAELSKALKIRLDKSSLDYCELHRNRSNHERLLLCEPGVEKLRPGPRTPFHNLFLAGDWVKNPVNLVCMEGAIASGEEAADLAIDYLEGKAS